MKSFNHLNADNLDQNQPQAREYYQDSPYSDYLQTILPKRCELLF